MQPPDPKALVDGAAALGVALSAEQTARLLRYLALLSKWNRVYNLTAVRDPSAMVVQHLLDSIAVIAPLRRWTDGRPARVLDAGSGAGLPGVVIAALMSELDTTCVDAVGKKASFIRQVRGDLGLRNLQAVHARVEDLSCEPFDVIVSRAFTTLADFISLTWRHRAQASVWLAMKAGIPTDEIAEVPKSAEVFHVEHLAVPGLAAERCLVWVRERT
jgi:16S rRNA (guanine527-N7)-methyltransferase